MKGHIWILANPNIPGTSPDMWRVWKCDVCGGATKALIGDPPGPTMLVGHRMDETRMVPSASMSCEDFIIWQVLND